MKNKTKKLIKVEKLAEKLIKEYLTGWKFEWMRLSAIYRYGDCNNRTKVIRLSPIIVEMNPISETEETIRHEIAHALSNTGHNKKFYAACKIVGAKQERCGVYKRPPIRKRTKRNTTNITTSDLHFDVYLTCQNCKNEYENGSHGLGFTEFAKEATEIGWRMKNGEPICPGCR